MEAAYLLGCMFSLIMYEIAGSASTSELFSYPPTITPRQSRVILENGTSFNFTCASQYPITWKPFKGFTGIYRVNYREIQGMEKRYESRIHLMDITHHYVGYFFCVANRTQLDYDYSVNVSLKQRLKGDLNGLNQIYLYVNDIHNLLVTTLLETTIFHNKYLLVPCKPTFPSVHATLTEGGQEANFVLYDKSIGFLIQYNDLADIYGTTFTCFPGIPIGQPIVFKVSHHIPKVHSATGLFGIQGEQLKLTCSTYSLKGQQIKMDWNFPRKRANPPKRTTMEHPKRRDLQIEESRITIDRIQSNSDQGYYECEVIDRSTRSSDKIFIEILKKGNNSVDIYALNEVYKMEMNTKGRTALWEVRYRGHPKPKLVWYNNFDKIVENSEKYEVTIANDYTILKINYLGLKDAGFYTLRATDSAGSAVERKFELGVKEAPTLEMVSFPESVRYDDTMEFICECSGYPSPRITWTFRECMERGIWPMCKTNYRLIEEKAYTTTNSTTASTQRSVLKMNAVQPGRVECIAANTEGIAKIEADVKITNKPFHVWILGNETDIYANSNVTIMCEASAYIYWDVTWYLDGIHVGSNADRKIERCDGNYTFCEKITWNQIKNNDSGTYACNTTSYNDESHPENVTAELRIEVHEPTKPEIISSSMENNEQLLGAPFQMFCYFRGKPAPKIEWFKEGKLIENGRRFTISNNKETLNIKALKMEDFGHFECVGSSRQGSARKSIYLKRIDQKANVIWLIIASVLLLLVIIAIIYSFLRFRRLKRELSAAGLANFEDGDWKHMNPELPLHEQADLLPYNRKFEFAKEKLKLGKQLGAGAFGVVLKAVATGILPYEEETTVAVKMLKKTAEIEEIRALVTELKIMVHLGKHLNVVNILGAVTKNIRKREMMVIVEYCPLGNLQMFLTKNRVHFIDQIKNGAIDPTILTKLKGKYVRVQTTPIYQNYYGNMDSGNTETSLTSSDSGSSTAVDNAIYAKRSITTTDLVCWSFQVARGMKYLSSKQVLHGDLAARNILLSVDNVVKICDFGLARSLYKSSTYKKEGEAPLPFKWLAIESIRDQVFSTYSDVWSFGILMWELFSLGSTPYPGMDANRDLFDKLLGGYRMDRPRNATQEIYDVMLHCWNVNPESRPLFSMLEEILGKFLGNEVAQHYINLNDDYVKMHNYNITEGQTDYLSHIRSPEVLAPENNSVKRTTGVAGYLPMKPIMDSDELGIGVTDNVVNNLGYY